MRTKTSLSLAMAGLSLSLMNQNSMFADNRPAMVYDQGDLFRSKHRTVRNRDLTKVRSKRRMEKHSRRRNRG